QGQQPSGNDRSSERQDRSQKKQTTKYGESKSRMASGSYEINVPFVCTFYNQKRCSKTNCTFLHICEGFLDSTCTGCTLSHNIKADQPLSVLSDYGFITSQNAETILERYKFRLQQAGKNHRGKTASRDKKETTREQEQKKRGRKGQNGNKSSHAGSIIQSEDVDICRNNIRERCKYGENCNRHHCNLPYHWQYKVPTQPWKSFPLVVNETLEMNFCDKDIDNAIVSVGNDRCVVDFNQMKGKVKDGELTLRRLSTSSACEAPPGETLVTNWTWYWKHENDGFQIHKCKYFTLNAYYESQGDSTVSEIGREIEEKYIENPENTIIINIGEYLYHIDFKNMKQLNLESMKERDVRRRPEYRSKEDVEREAKERRKICRKVDIKQSSLQQQSGDLPNHWVNMNDEERGNEAGFNTTIRKRVHGCF
ncbi:hypothetical protein KUTeg_010575, partial [Tegillarca granosa]